MTARPLTRAQIEAELPKVRARIDDGITAYDDRLALWAAAVALEPPMKQREIAALSGVKTSAVGVALGKAGISKPRKRQ